MSTAMNCTPVSSLSSPTKPGLIGGSSSAPKVIFINNLTNQKSKNERFQALEVKATDSTKSVKSSKSILCEKCEGNGSLQCTQCKGKGVNSEDHFNGRFKAGALCWLCRGKKEILCGECNGAGYGGGFMSTGEQ